MATVTVKYSCVKCGVKDREIQIPQRLFNESVTRWMREIVAKALSKDHRSLSPHCDATSAQNLKIPITREGVGVPGEPLTDEEQADLDRRLKEMNSERSTGHS